MADSSRTVAVAAENLSYRYDDRAALNRVNAKFYRGEVTAIIGGNGAGKSTLLNLIAGVLEPSSGRVVNAIDVRPAFVLQKSLANSNLPFTVYESVAMGRWAERGALGRLRAKDREIIHEALQMLDIEDLAKRQLSELSGGQRQRVLLAQGVAQQSELLLLDEPIAGLDAAAELRIAEVIRNLSKQGKTIIQATHSMHAAHESDHCLVLTNGELIAEGYPEDVLTERNLVEFF